MNSFIQFGILIFKIFRFIMATMLIISIIFLILWIYNRHYIYRICVELPNGLFIGRTALFDHKKHWMDVGVVIKSADGKVLIPDYIDNFYFNDKAAYGGAMPMFRHEDSYGFAWRADTGVVLKKDDPDLYEKVVASAKPPSGVPGLLDPEVHTNLAGVYFALKDSPDYRREYCPLSVFPE